MTVAEHPAVSTEAMAAPSAVVWVNGKRAIVAAMGREGSISTCDISRGSLREPDYLAQIVRVIGDRERVVILGPGAMRLALEREYVTIYHRPERLVDVEPAEAVDAAALVERLRTLAA